MDITEPLVLSRGSHQPGSGRGCAMNVIAWELGGEITDYPSNVHPALARMVQMANDELAVPTMPHPGPKPPAVDWVEGAAYPLVMHEEYRQRAQAYNQSFVVPAKHALRLLDIAHETLDTNPDNLDPGVVSFGARDRFPVLAVYLDEIMRHARESDFRSSERRAKAVLDTLDKHVQLFRMWLGLPRKRPTAPSVDVINDALRKMSVKA